MTENIRSDDSRRSFLTKSALMTTALALGAGGASSLVGGQEARDIELEAYSGGWEGVTPADIEGEENPTLSFEAGEDYTVTWTNGDNNPHSFVIEDADENEIVQSEVIEEGSQTVEFTATEEMAEYYCEVHPDSMRGTVELGGEGDEEMENEESEEQRDDSDEEPREDDEEMEDDDEEMEDDDPASELPREFHADLMGEPHGIETEAMGEARFWVSDDEMEVDYELEVEDICNVTQAHIHLGADSEDGPVVVWLYPEEGMEPELVSGRFSGTLAEGTITADDLIDEWEGADMADAVETFVAEGAYVNVHTEEHPGGEIRGQIMSLNE